MEDIAEPPAIEHPIPLSELPENVTVLPSQSGGWVYLIGTAHVSKVSVDHVRQVIQQVQPTCIVIELCKSRLGILFQNKEEDAEKQKMPLADKIKSIRSQGGAQFLQIMLSEAVGNMTKDLGQSGAEFKAAVEEAIKLQARVILGDRPIQVTFKRTWARLSLYEKAKILCSILYVLTVGFKVNEEDVEKLKNGDLITEMMEELAQQFPGSLETIVYERDLYLAHSLRRVPGISVGVVGLGHVKGIKETWDKEIDIERISALPPDSGRSLVKPVLLIGASVLIGIGGIIVKLCFF